MKKDNFDQYQDDVNLGLKRKGHEDVLEISSTGYGLESVSTETEEQQRGNGNPSCGGL